MSVKRIAFIISACCLIGIACNNVQNKKTAPPSVETGDSSDNAFRIRTGLEYEPALLRADSLELLFFDDPDGDSLRYTRFFQYTATSDSLTIQELLASLGQSVEQRNYVKDCRSEGKIYVYGKQEPIKTVYFSTRCDSCCYLYYIKSGMFYYTALTPAFKNKLAERKKASKKP